MNKMIKIFTPVTGHLLFRTILPPGILNLNHVVDKRFKTFEARPSDGKYFRDNVDADTSEIKHYDGVELDLVGVDKNVYTYLSEAEQIACSNDNLVAPATPVSNITGDAWDISVH
jgi:hypothetical protein